MMMRLLMRGRASSAVYVAGASYAVSGSSRTFDLSGYAVGDLVFVFAPFTLNSTPSISGVGGWARDVFTWTLYGYNVAAFWKRVVLSDLTTLQVNGTQGNSTLQVVGYRGPSAASLKSTAQSGAADTTLVFSGFTKSSRSAGIVSMVSDRDPDSLSFVKPTGWTNRLGPFAGVLFASGVADASALAYPNGTSITWTNFTGSGGGGGGTSQVGFLYEMT